MKNYKVIFLIILLVSLCGCFNELPKEPNLDEVSIQVAEITSGGTIITSGELDNFSIDDTVLIGTSTVPGGKVWRTYVIPKGYMLIGPSDNLRQLKDISGIYIYNSGGFQYDEGGEAEYSVLNSGTYTDLQINIYHYIQAQYGYTDGGEIEKVKRSPSCKYWVMEETI